MAQKQTTAGSEGDAAHAYCVETPREVHVFANGIRVYDVHLIPKQRQRYAKRNVHEADEEDIFVELVSSLPPNGSYLNIGCAIGYYPLLAKRLKPELRIHAVEPLTQHREYFAENVRLNGLEPGDFTLHERAVAATEGKARFREQDYGSVLLRGAARPPISAKGLLKKLLVFLGVDATEPKAEKRPVRIVKTTTLDKLVAAMGGTADLVSMDVQGLEAEVLKGGARMLREGRVKTFLIGTHGRVVHQVCVEELQRHGYDLEFSEPLPKDQPDGILVASKGIRRLGQPPRN